MSGEVQADADRALLGDHAAAGVALLPADGDGRPEPGVVVVFDGAVLGGLDPARAVAVGVAHAPSMRGPRLRGALEGG